jgi:hypothetical protein
MDRSMPDYDDLRAMVETKVDRMTNSRDHSLKPFNSEWAFLIQENCYLDWTAPYFANYDWR